MRNGNSVLPLFECLSSFRIKIFTFYDHTGKTLFGGKSNGRNKAQGMKNLTGVRLIGLPLDHLIFFHEYQPEKSVIPTEE